MLPLNIMLGVTLYNMDLVTNTKVPLPLIKSPRFSYVMTKVEEVEEFIKNVVSDESKLQRKRQKTEAGPSIGIKFGSEGF